MSHVGAHRRSRPHAGRHGSTHPNSARGTLDDLEAIAVGIAEIEHRGHAWPAQHLAHRYPEAFEPRVFGLRVEGEEADPGLHASGRVAAGGFEGKANGRVRGRNFDPASAVAEWPIVACFEAQDADVEALRAFLVSHTDADGVDADDLRRLRCLHRKEPPW